MGAFLFVTNRSWSGPEDGERRARESLHLQGFAAPKEVGAGPHLLLLYDKLDSPCTNHVEFAQSDFSAAAGTFFYKGMSGYEGLVAAHRDFAPPPESASADSPTTIGLDESRLHGTFVLFLMKHGRLFLFSDRLGLYKTYHDSERKVFSSSFLALAASRAYRHCNTQAVYEYLFQGATYGGETLLQDVNLLSSDYFFDATGPVNAVKRHPFRADSFATDSISACEARIDGILRRQFSDLRDAFQKGIDTALSGGFDSRLVLAHLFAAEASPRVHVYGRINDPDVRIAQRIAAGEDFAIDHQDKSRLNGEQGTSAPETVSRNFLAFDGAPTDGIFNSGADLASRRQRCRNGVIALNGGGGEVFRNFFYLPNRPYTARQIVWSFYSQFDPAVGTSGFSEAEYHERLEVKLRHTLGVEERRLSRCEVELLYPLFRCRYWMGRNNSVNNRFGLAHTPLCDPGIVPETVRLPLSYKDFGRLEGRLIARANPALASYPSEYGFPFDVAPPLSYRLRTASTSLRPPLLRRYTFRWRTRYRSPPSLPVELGEAFRDAVMTPGFPRLSTLVNPAAFVDTGQLNRLCTLEYLFQQLDVNTHS